MIFTFTFQSVVNLKWLFLCGMQCGLRFIFNHKFIQLLQHQKTWHSSMNILGNFAKNQLNINVWIFFLLHWSVHHTSVNTLLPYLLQCWSKSWNQVVYVCPYILLHHFSEGILDTLHFHISFRIVSFYTYIKAC